jgi:isopentenyl-diphosphate delta-isomerase
MEEVILVNERDEQVGTMEKMEAHIKGELHRAFSVFIFNEKNEMLLQQRALSKYHSAGLWTNACCSHPRPGESTESAATRRLQEELGFNTSITKIFDFKYNSSFNNGLIEHEFDHVFVGAFSGPLHPNPDEVQDYRYNTIEEISNSINSNPEVYTTWFCIAFPMVKRWLSQNADHLI